MNTKQRYAIYLVATILFVHFVGSIESTSLQVLYMAAFGVAGYLFIYGKKNEL